MDNDDNELEQNTREEPAIVAEPTTDPASEPEPQSAVHALVEKWWNDMFPGSIIARDTLCWNHAMSAKEELKKRLS